MNNKLSTTTRVAQTLAAIALMSFAATSVSAQGLGPEHPLDETTTSRALKQQGFSPYAGRTYPTQVYWGDQHVHTGWSVDGKGDGGNK